MLLKLTQSISNQSFVDDKYSLRMLERLWVDMHTYICLDFSWMNQSTLYTIFKDYKVDGVL